MAVEGVGGDAEQAVLGIGSGVAGVSLPLARDQGAGSATACWFGLSIAHLCGDLVCTKLRR